MTEIECQVCKGKAYRNRRGQVLAHTTPATGGRKPSTRFGWATFSDIAPSSYVPAEICPGSDKGARAC